MSENNSPVPTEPAPTEEPTANTPVEPIRLPDDHPLVTAFQAVKKELAEKSQRLQEVDDSKKSETEKLAERLSALENENSTLKAEKLRAEVAASKGVPAHLLSGATKEELEAAADALLEFRGQPGSPLPGNQRPAGPVSQVQEREESREDRRKRLAESLKR